MSAFKCSFLNKQHYKGGGWKWRVWYMFFTHPKYGCSPSFHFPEEEPNQLRCLTLLETWGKKKSSKTEREKILKLVIRHYFSSNSTIRGLLEPASPLAFRWQPHSTSRPPSSSEIYCAQLTLSWIPGSSSHVWPLAYLSRKEKNLNPQ